MSRPALSTLLALGLTLLGGCGGAEVDAAPTSDPLQGLGVIGGAASSDPLVGALWITQSDGTAQFCSGVAIGPQTFLTVAHCFDHVQPDSRFRVVFADNAFAAPDAGRWVGVDDFAADPGFQDNLSPTLTHERDFGLVHLTERVEGPYPALNRYPLDRLGLYGKPVRLVGLGRTSTQDNAAGPRREVTKTDYRVATDTEIEGGPQGGIACRGDSGGPLFFTTPAGQSAIAGVDSRGDLACQEIDIATRVDAELPFISDFMARHGDSPSCDADGRCGFGCAAPDPDCPCEPDGFCTSACATPAADPDCPQSCLHDGGRCADPDPPLDHGCGCTSSGDALLMSFALVLLGLRSRRRGR